MSAEAKPRILKPLNGASNALDDHRGKMYSILCEVCKDYADLESWSATEIENGACSPCHIKLQKAGLVD